MTERAYLTVLVSLLFLSASAGIMVAVYLWFFWYFSFHEVRQRPLEDGIKLPKKQGLSEADLQRLPTIECHDGEEEGGEERHSGEGKDECSVCLEAFRSGQRCRVIPVCSHTFHVQCADAWLSRRSNCPICRRSAACEEAVIGDAAAALREEEGREEDSRRSPPLTAENVVINIGYRDVLYHTG